MKVARLKIENFRGIKTAELHFDGHTLFVGGNNVGKSTVCEALDLVLNPERLNKFPPVDEYDFHNSEYLDQEGKPLPLIIEVVLVYLTNEVKRQCNEYLEFWHLEEKRVLDRGDIEHVNNNDDDSSSSISCLRLQMKARYNQDEDEFEAATYFAHSSYSNNEELKPVNTKIKRLFGFLYLRALRTGNRALSLERGSLLDTILRIENVRTNLWEKIRSKLKELALPADTDTTELLSIMDDIEKRLGSYIFLEGEQRKTGLYVSKLTREHLRKTLSFFLTISKGQTPIPFERVGTGTLNTLVLALLSFIASSKKNNFIFAMEEPEIALPPHTQKRIASYLLLKPNQCFVTSHSPYVIECFQSDQIAILKRSATDQLEAVNIKLPQGVKNKTYQRHFRKSLAEAILSCGVIVGEGLTERTVLKAASVILEENRKDLLPFDLAGICIISADGDGALSEFGQFFQSTKIPVYAFYDNKNRSHEEKNKLENSFDIANQTNYSGMEELLAQEIPLDKQKEYLTNLRKNGHNEIPVLSTYFTDDEIRNTTRNLLKRKKGETYAVDLLEYCNVEELPVSITNFLYKIYERHSSIQEENLALDKEQAIDLGNE